MDAQNRIGWSVGVGRWCGTPVRLHMLFFVFALFTFYFGWYATHKNIAVVGEFTALASLVILLASVTLHELGHLFVVRRCHCRIHLVELLPWGGWSRFDSPRHSPSRLMIHLAGPLVNLGICAIAAFLLMQKDNFDGRDLKMLLNPIRPLGLFSDDFVMCVIKLTFWINWSLLLINLIPVFPFDGGNILRSAVPLIGKNTSPHQAYLICLVFAQLTALSLFFFAWVLRDSNPNELVPTWFVLVMLGIIVFFSSKRQAVLDGQHLEQADLARVTAHAFHYEDSGYFDLEEQADETSISDWLQQHKLVREQIEYETEEEEDRRVDEILQKLHETGMNSISEPEKELLHRVSHRYRHRHRHENSRGM
jgi:Zn-dependent protease